MLPRVFTAMITPFNTDGDVDYEEAGTMAAWLVAHGSGGLILSGTTGESPALTDTERMNLLRAVRAAVGNDVPLWMGTGTNNTRHSRELSWQAAEAGADGVLLVCPYYNKPPQEGLIRHFVDIADGLPVPAMLYNIPGRTGVNLLPQTARTIIQECPNVIAIKEAAGSLPQMQELINLLSPATHVYAGDDAMYYPALTLGAYGVVSVASHLVGCKIQEMTQAVEQGDLHEARRINGLLMPLFQELFRYTNPISVKWAMNYLGFHAGDVRLPLATPGDPRAFDELRLLIDQLVPQATWPRAC
ncbi:MAG: 4-hydroxy-tetrahydrodipicolinate synthase [Sulfobacillus thermosulfidooxidans]|uniref:4-hydroxy-tetrahydrodipicolinate synthase n=1 Tax=Sulfobacillus TaxID=28033 RepID=UPI000CD01CF0|nr:4-hydroxy-tetrahydrodipicolinate synthase [Sulfobacillus sp. hq2]POB11601.1 4-hydroxy-tetrahydrodipicolinate synthase [Sulfobacillus sp. hq2]PSR36605.1 MAG: 4-hydroxy-tetrahydrodipicolinate synthase [Sulfobacillus thermosulfidooxidans]